MIVERPAVGRRSGGISSFLRWYAPYVRGHRVAFVGGAAMSAVVLISQGLIPFVVERLLHNGEWEWRMILLLIVLILGQLVCWYGVSNCAHFLTNLSATRLRLAIFDRTLETEALHQHVLRRASIVTRVSTDVDEVAGAFQLTLASGLPAVVRVVQSLVLLIIIEWRAGLAMAIAVLVFMGYRTHVGRALFAADHARLATSSDLRANVDEALVASRAVTGLHLQQWLRGRFARVAQELHDRTGDQEDNVLRLELGGHATGLFGLLAVVVFALLVGGSGLAHIAAAILFVEGVVAGLEALPPWLRSVQFGATSQVRIDSILGLPDRIAEVGTSKVLGVPAGIELDDLSAHFESGQRLESISLFMPAGRLIGVVTPMGAQPDDFMSLIAGDANPQSGRVLIDGYDARMPRVNRAVAH